MSDDTVRVAVRIRPLVKSELERGCQACLNVVPGEPQIVIRNTEKAFTFNYVLPPDIGQEDFYKTAIMDMVKNIFEGKIALLYIEAMVFKWEYLNTHVIILFYLNGYYVWV